MCRPPARWPSQARRSARAPAGSWSAGRSASARSSVLHSLRGFQAREVVADEVLQRDRYLLAIECRLRVVVEEVEDRCVRHQAVVVEAHARARAGLIGAAAAAA